MLRRFLNTGIGAREPEGFEEVGRWLEARGLVAKASELTREERRRVLDVRGGLRALLAVPPGGRPEARVVSDLQEALGSLRYDLVLNAAGRPAFVPAAEGVDAAIGSLMAIATRWLGAWPRLKVCGACGRVFYDGLRGTAKWCSLRCGDRMRGRKYRTTEKFRETYKRRRKTTS